MIGLVATVTASADVTSLGLVAKPDSYYRDQFVESRIIIPSPTPVRSIGTVPVQRGSPELRELVFSMLREAGVNTAIADRVINCESGWNPLAYNGRNLNGSNDAGLWQINSIHPLTLAERYDPVISTRYAIHLITETANSWNHWVCYKKLY